MSVKPPLAVCRVCGTSLQSATALLCVRCYRWNMQRCPACTENGRVRSDYRIGRKRNGRLLPARNCAVCLNDRFVLRDPPELPPEGF